MKTSLQLRSIAYSFMVQKMNIKQSGIVQGRIYCQKSKHFNGTPQSKYLRYVYLVKTITGSRL